MKQFWKIGVLFALLPLIVLLASCTHSGGEIDTDTTQGTSVQTTEPSDVTEAPDESGTISDNETETEFGGETDEAHTHTFGEWQTTADATCTEAGVKERTCVCGEVETETVPVLAHSETVLKGEASTCTVAGRSDGKKCTVCDTVTVQQTELPLAAHTYDNDADTQCNLCPFVRDLACKHTTTVKIPVVAPTCTGTGLTEGKKCSLCEEIVTPQATVDATGHTEATIDAVAPTCTASGLTAGKKCSVCGTITVAQKTVDATGHTEATIDAVAPTCTASGLTAGKKCSVCGTITVAQKTVDATGHTEETIPAVDATLTSTGLSEGKKCTVCKTVTVPQEVIPKLQDPNAWDGSIAAGFSGGSGTEKDPYLISSGAELAFLARQINSGSKIKYYQMHYRLTKDINLDGREWDPIGCYITDTGTLTTARSFMGVFDGNGYVVSNFKITTPASNRYLYFGLFGRVHGTIQNLGVENFYIELNHSTAMNVGGLAGYIENAKILRCYVTGQGITVRLSVGNLGTNVGGLIGAGGLSTVTDSYACIYISSMANESGAYTVAGGLIGSTGNSIMTTHCYAGGTVSVMAHSLASAGGLFGGGGNSGNEKVYSVAFGNVSSVCGNKNNEKAGGLAISQYVYGGYRYDRQGVGGNTVITAGTTCTAAQLSSASFYTDTLGWDSSVWDFSELDFQNGKYPKLKVFAK